MTLQANPKSFDTIHCIASALVLGQVLVDIPEQIEW